MPNKPQNFPYTEEDCERPACADTIAALNSAIKRSSTTTTTSKKSQKEKSIECPPGTKEIGNGTWTLLHTMAAWYPDKPSLGDETKMKHFIDGLAAFFPCTHCAEDFRMNIQEKPVRTQSRKELCQWMCEQHNIVNEKIHKPKQFPCDMKSLDERWRKSTDPRCFKEKKVYYHHKKKKEEKKS